MLIRHSVSEWQLHFYIDKLIICFKKGFTIYSGNKCNKETTEELNKGDQ